MPGFFAVLKDTPKRSLLVVALLLVLGLMMTAYLTFSRHYRH
jgi:hypothetical protein